MKTRSNMLVRSRGFTSDKSSNAAATAVVEKESFAKTNPFAFQIMIATMKTSAADLLTQVVAEKKKLTEGTR